jgi:hypothetical protein
MVSYNTRELTLAALRSVQAETADVSYEIRVVDNASHDGSAGAIASEFPEVALYASPENLGFGRAVNLAAREAEGRYLLLLNPDTCVLDRAIDRLVAFAERHPAPGIYGGVTLHADGSPNPTSCWNRPTLWSAFAQGLGLSALLRGSRFFDCERVPAARLDAPHVEVDIVTGCFLLIRRELWEALGGFDPAFFMYGEDFDLCLRARALGARPCVVPEARIIHHGGASERVPAEKLERLLRSKVQLYHRHWSRPAAALGRLCLLLWVLTRRVGYRAGAWLGREGARERAHAWDRVWARRQALSG